jgi:uncharacterized membrane protein YfcA
MEIIGYFGALLMGLSLGLIGGGGSILTVPILVYLFSIQAVLATSYSLFIVGFTSVVGSLSHVSQGNIQWKTAILFGLPSIVGVYLTRVYVLDMIPQEITHIQGFVLTKPLFLLLLFAVIMLFASVSMIRQSPMNNEQLAMSNKQLTINNEQLLITNEQLLIDNEQQSQPSTTNTQQQGTLNLKQGTRNYVFITLEGLVVGGITGLVGAGGGFLIIPALVILAKLPMKQAIGTSLVIIALKSLIGFSGDLKNQQTIDWTFLLSFAGIAVVGIVIGSLLSKKISNETLKPTFGWFVLVMGIYIIVKELFLK